MMKKIFRQIFSSHQISRSRSALMSKRSLGSAVKMSDAKSEACAAIDRQNDALRSISLELWDNPELAFQEHRAHKVLTDYLEQRGFKVERHYKLETAFRASVESGNLDPDSPTIGVMCEYDALPGIGHACGHNLIAILGLSVSLGIKEALLNHGIKGKLVVLGCPAEEGGGGKIELIKAGAYDDLDLAMMAHPSQWSLPKPIYVAMGKVRVTFQGKVSHASSFPWDGVNALDAAVLCYQSVSCMRQQMRPTWRVHGIFTKAGEQPNIIPETAELLFYFRAPNSPELKVLQAKLQGCFDGAALSSGCSVNCDFDPKSYASLMSNDILSGLYVSNGQSIGLDFESDQMRLNKQGGSTDMGNVSRVVPSVHPKYSLHTMLPAHTEGFRDLAKAPKSHDLTVLHAKALAMAAIDVYSKPALVPEMKAQLKAQLDKE